MKLVYSFDKWYKGNLHTHTNLSDGLKSPEECIELYKSEGYDFISITDHRKCYNGCSLNERMLVLKGIELHINDLVSKRAYHIVGIGIKGDIYSDDSFKPQQLIDEINEKDGLAVIAHPAWSLLTHMDIMELKGYHGIEIWNSVSETDSGRGDSTGYVDVLASKGIITNIYAVDDTHFYRNELFGGYVMVNSSSLSEENILKSIRNGDFYCSQGPEIKQIYIDEGQVAVETSPVESIKFMTDTFFAQDRVHVSKNESITKASYVIKPTDSYVRIECADKSGKKAWSQIIAVNR